MGTMTKKIELLLIEANISKKELANRLGTKQSNLSGKLKRNNFSEQDLQDIAKACGARFEGTFVINDTGKKI
ncbi:MAG: helix-turn-helix transcriptional regulator [Eubacteriales bacterium]